MDAIPLFLNDGSYPSVADDREIEGQVLQVLRTLKGIKALSRPFVLGTAVSLPDIPLSNAYRTLAAFAVVDREWWRFIKALDQRTPFSAVSQCVPPNENDHIVGDRTQAPLWVHKNGAFMISFPVSSELQGRVVSFDVCSCVDGFHDSQSIDCRNLSMPAHVSAWRAELLDFNYVASASSTIYQEAAYQLKMYLHDHDPPHVHVYEASDLRRCVGRVRCDYVEIMEDDGFSGAVRKDVLALVRMKRDELLRAWDRCRSGNLPNRIVLD